MNDWILTIAPVIGLLGNVLTQIVVAHATHNIGRSIMAGALSGFVVTLAVVAVRSGAGLDVPIALLIATTYLAFAFGFWTFLNLNITSLRIRMLRTILDAPGGLTQAELMASYPADEFLGRRLERLQQRNDFQLVEGRWRLESKTLLILANAINLTRAIILPRQRE